MNDNYPKITRTQPISAPESRTDRNRTKSDDVEGFGNILSDKLKADQQESKSGLTPTLPEIQGNFSARNLNLSVSESDPFTDKLTESLGLLERYAEFLGDPDKNLKQAYSLLEQLISQTDNLSEQINQTSGQTQTEELKSILAQLMTTARVEQVKFNRGDYL